MTRAATSRSMTWEIPAAGLFHVALAGLALLTQCERESTPLFKADDVMMVEMAGPPKMTTRMPQKAERAPDVPKGSDASAQPPPPNPSYMAFCTPDAPEASGDPNAARQALIDKMRREQAIRDLSAPEGTVDRSATSPEGSDVAGESAQGGIHDPEVAKWIKEVDERVRGNWHPLLSICQTKRDLAVVVTVDVDATGKTTSDPTVRRSSANASLDGSALRAVEATPQLPAPPPRFTDGVTATITFPCKSVL